MNQPLDPKSNLPSAQQPGISQQVDGSTLGGGMLAAIGDDNVQIEGDSNIVTFNKTEILQIAVEEIKTRQFIETSPYKGLKKFEPEDKDLFFGRDQFLTGLVNELEQTNLILLLGASGSGKSSVVRAGLIPWLSQKLGSRFVHLTFTPDGDPFESFYASLLSKYKQVQVQGAREAKLGTLTQVVTRLKQPDDYWFILIDQFEELFTTTQLDKRDQFIASLVQLSKTKQRSVKIVATMRADFLDHLSPYPQLVKATDKHRPFIAQMQRDELRLAIEQPAAQHGVVFEEGLVEEIIKNVQGQAGYLPLLQYTLNLVWETEVKNHDIGDRTLNISTYRQLGGVWGALHQRVEKIYNNLTKEEQAWSQRIFLRLVEIGGDEESGTEWKPVRRRATRFEFSEELEKKVLTQLIDQNLLVSNYQPQSEVSTVEIAHEALLTSWTRLNEWIGENRQAIALRNRLNEDVANWQKTKGDDELWGGSRLEQALELKQNEAFNQVLGGFCHAANQFIDASVGRRDRTRQGELRQARRIATGAVSAALLISAAGIFAFAQWTESQKRNILTLVQSAKANLLANQQLEAMIDAVNAEQQSRHLLFGRKDVNPQTVGMLTWVASEIRERNRWQGMQTSIRKVVFSPDGQRIATAGKDGTTKLWDLAGHPLVTIATQQRSVYSVVFSPDGQRIATAGDDGTTKLWDLAGHPLVTIATQQRSVYSVVFSPDGQRIATAGDDGTTKLWNLAGKGIATITTQQKSLYEVAFSPDGQRIATAGEDGMTKLWNLTGKLIISIATHQRSVFDVKFSPDGQRIATAGEDGTTKLWNLAGKLITTIPTQQGQVWSLAFSPNGQRLVTAGSDASIKLWDLTGKPITSITTHQGSVRSVAFSPNSQWLATGGSDGTTKLWDLTDKRITSIATQQGAVYSLVFSPNGQRLATSGNDGTAKLWDLAGNRTAKITTQQGSVYNVVFSPDGQELATTGGNDDTAKLWNLAGKLITMITTQQTRVWSVAFSPDGKQLVTAGNDSTIKFWDLRGKFITMITTQQGAVYSVAFSPDGKQLVTAGDDSTIKLWDLTGKLITTIPTQQGKVRSVAFSPDGKQLVTAAEDSTIIQLWDLTGKLITTIPTQQGKVWSVAFSPDGKQLVTAGDDSTIKLWDFTGKLIATIFMQQGSVYSVAFSPDGQWLAASRADGTIKLWQIGDTKELLTKSCDWLWDYLHNPSENRTEKNRNLCDGVRESRIK